MEHYNPRNYRGPETWARVREAYLAGEPAPALARRFDVGLANLRKKAREGGWTRRRHALAVDPPGVRRHRRSVRPAPSPAKALQAALAMATEAVLAGAASPRRSSSTPPPTP